MEKMMLGFHNEDKVELSLRAVQRHIACFGASGSGKTVACKVIIEELARFGVPVIIFDPQGDIASLINVETDDAMLLGKSVPVEIRNAYAGKAEVVIWTPGSSKGLPLSINPLQFDDLEGIDAEDRLRYFSATAKNVAELIGYDSDNDEGKSAESVLTAVFEYCFDKQFHLGSFNNLIDLLNDLPESVNNIIGAVISLKSLGELIKKLRFLTLGSRKLIFETGYPARIESLLGLDEPNNGKTRISVIYLNTLGSQKEKEFFMANITQMLYNWMLRNPLKSGQDGIQAVLYIDEIAPFLPPVKMPACKESLMLLFKQARKYGVGCLIATQNPGDIDYKSIAQISTYLIGNLKTKQDLSKIETRLESMSPTGTADIMNRIPSLGKGKFLLLSPDEYKEMLTFQVRWLVTRHDVISEEQLPGLIPVALREKYAVNRQKTEIPPVVLEITNEDQLAPLAEKPVLTPVPDPPSETEAGENSKETVLIADHRLFESDLNNRIRPFLRGIFFNLIKQEKLQQAAFDYHPLIKADMIFSKEKGFFKKTIIEIPLSLYIDYKSYEILSLRKRSINFEALVSLEPHKIQDFDERIQFDRRKRDEVQYDFRRLGKKINPVEIVTMLERKYKVKVSAVDVVLLPVWDCTVMAKKGPGLRKVSLDALLGYKFSK
ncbi:MAG: ATP-binding protein [Bacteroidetes bacterium]|nr:ATP-binding protein [Bacteroidota bacterium]